VLVVASNLGAVAAPDVPLERLAWPLAALAVSVLSACTLEVLRYQAPGQAFEHLALAVFGQVYVGLLLAFIVQLRLLSGGPDGREDRGIAALASLLIVVKTCDTGAYAVGRLLGRRKMCPRLSPGKTWEGTAGGLISACLGAWFSLNWLAPRLAPSLAGGAAWWRWLAFGLLVGLAGVAGDLLESLLKRDAGRKDSSAWLPGFGGVLDLLDSLLFAAPVAWLCWQLALVGS
jgi:phosphatidate cytidylyltransferase